MIHSTDLTQIRHALAAGDMLLMADRLAALEARLRAHEAADTLLDDEQPQIDHEFGCTCGDCCRKDGDA
jgi:hypothetical protein